jgi:[phosphatase 2A protein]-leucine-carboxy methyltransferase
MSQFRELKSVEDTARDAANAKCSAVRQRYYADPYIQYFVGEQVRQIPPMNLGYFVRSLSMLAAIAKFHKSHGNSIQVVVLGCGYDTLFWRLRDAGVSVGRWFDVDLPHVVNRKSSVVFQNSLFDPLDNYALLECDMGQPNLLESVLKDNGFSVDVPTVFVDECTLIYVDPEAVDLIIQFAGRLKASGFISYGMIRPEDQFGKLMVKNFQSFGAPLKGIEKYPTVESHRTRFLNGGYTKVKAVDMDVAMKKLLTREENIRVHRLEIHDDPEELAYMLSHYVLAIASTDDEFLAILP